MYRVILTRALSPLAVLAGFALTTSRPAAAGDAGPAQISALPSGGCFGAAEPLFLGDQPRLCAMDAGKVVFVRGADRAHDVWVRDLATGKETQVTSGAADDIHPDFFPDCKRIAFSSNRKGSYDIWTVALGQDAAGGAGGLEDGKSEAGVGETKGLAGAGEAKSAARAGELKQITSARGDESLPRVSPIRFSMRGLHPISCGGPWDEEMAVYHKIVYAASGSGATSGAGTKPRLESVADDGRILSVLKDGCQEGVWTADGLGMLFLCGSEAHIGRAVQLTADTAIDAVGGDPAVQDFMTRVDEGAYGEDVDPEQGDALLAKLLADKSRRKLYLAFGKPAWTLSAGRMRQVSPSLNQMVALAVSGKGTASKLAAAATAGGDPQVWYQWSPAAGAAWPAWSPDGHWLYFSARNKDATWVFRTATTCPLQDVTDLPLYPELIDRGLSRSLAENRFAARESADKEFFHQYEKLRYAGKGILITPDTVLQSFADVVSRLVQDRELDMADALQELSRESLDWVLGHCGEMGRADQCRYLAVVFGVPALLLESSRNVNTDGFSDPYYDPPEEEGEERPDPDRDAARELAAGLDAIPEPYQTDIREALGLLDAGQLEVLEGGRLAAPRRLAVDFSMARPRGHYTGPRYRQYFQAMSWLGLFPLPVNESVAGYGRWLLESPCTPPPQPVPTRAADDAADAAMARDQPDKTPMMLNCPIATYRGLDEFAGILAGPHALPGLDLLLEELKRAGARPDLAAIRKRIAASFKVRVRSLEAALEQENEGEVLVFPKRLGPDAEILKATTHPDVDRRGLPTALDLFAALGLDFIRGLVTVPEGELWSKPAWEAALTAIGKELAARKPGAAASMYDRWVALLRTLAGGYVAADGQGRSSFLPEFADKDAYRLRLLTSALAGFAQVKHHMVLYSFQNYGVECDAWSPIVILYEQPVKPRPPVYVEPHEPFYRELAGLCREIGRTLSVPVAPLRPTPEGCDKPFVLGCDGAWDDALPLCPSTCTMDRYEERTSLQVLSWVAEVLADIAARELAGKPLDDWEYEVGYTFGAVLEALFLDRNRMDAGQSGADQGRQERGIALVADIYTNVQRNLVLHDAVGRPYDLYAVVTFDGSRHIVQGGMLSWYEFTWPGRMNDQEWWELLNREPDRVRTFRPPWTSMFVE